MIYTLGDSFTKWHWPTWSDWLGIYLAQPVTNLAWPGYTNELIYYQLLELSPVLSKSDTVYIMWTGNNRVCEWYDAAHVKAQDIAGFFPDTQGKLWFSSDQEYQGFYKTHPDHLPSLTHMVISNFEIMMRTQWLLNSIGCDYRMMFWQNPWADTREVFQPTYQSCWHLNSGALSSTESQQARQILQVPMVRSVLCNLNWSKFHQAPADITDPDDYQGLWEFMLASPELTVMNHVSDHHPNTLVHHDWVTRVMLPGQPVIHRADAHAQARDHQKCQLPDTDYRAQGIIRI